jgi:hypothetical protein
LLVVVLTNDNVVGNNICKKHYLLLKIKRSLKSHH